MSEIKYDTKECPLYIGNTCHALDKAYRVGRADAIDEFFNELQKAFVYYYGSGRDSYEISEIVRNKMLKQIKEQTDDHNGTN